MRVTNRTLLNNYLANLNRNLRRMSKYQDQLSSGKEIRRPSDDPFGATRSMALHTSLNQNKQYLRNIEDSLGWVDITDSALGNMGDIMNRLRELVIKGANGSLSDSDRNAIKDEVVQLIEQMAQIGNANYDGRYIFGGQRTTKPPFHVDHTNGYLIEYSGDHHMLKREISPNVVIEVNIPGEWIKGGKDGSLDLPITLSSIVAALESGDSSQLGGILLEELDANIDSLLSLRSEAGAKYNRLESAKMKNEEESFNMTDLLSKTEDIDFAEKIMHYMMMENIYYASLATGAKIMQPSLLDFLK